MKPISEMTDSEVLDAAQGMGPALIGQELFDRAQQVRQQNPTGSIGPAILNSEPTPAKVEPPKVVALEEDEADEEGEADEVPVAKAKRATRVRKAKA